MAVVRQRNAAQRPRKWRCGGGGTQCLGEPTHALERGEVERHHLNLAGERRGEGELRANAIRGIRESRRRATGQHDRRALLGQPERSLIADASIRACDDSDLVAHVHARRLSNRTLEADGKGVGRGVADASEPNQRERQEQ